MPLDGPAKPQPKSAQLARGERRYRRKVASPKRWQAIIDAKGATCRLVADVFPGPSPAGVQYHHLVPRDLGGDDVADNIVPLCQHCHQAVTRREPDHVRHLLAALTDAEYAYATGFGEDVFERAYGLRYVRA